MFYTALFKPSKKMDYSDQAKKLAGKQIAVQDGWIIQEGPFEGQQCYYIPNTHVGWIPACDLKEIEPISYTRWQEIVKTLNIE
jgi:hypothetical protein